jgi:uncharacterized protein YrzB (UPF0473 family)
MDENNEELDNVITLKDEEGNDVNFEFLDLIEYEGEEYVILLPMQEVEEDAEPDEVVILKIEKTEESENSDEETYVSVEDEDVLNAVFEIFKDKFKDEFNFVD